MKQRVIDWGKCFDQKKSGFLQRCPFLKSFCVFDPTRIFDYFFKAKCLGSIKKKETQFLFYFLKS